MSAPLDDIAGYSLSVNLIFSCRSRGDEAQISWKMCGLMERNETPHVVSYIFQTRTYSYEAYRGDEKIGWYDSWPHPEIPALASTFPHHKHILPDLRNHRVPAPGIQFDAPNLDTVLADVRREWLR